MATTTSPSAPNRTPGAHGRGLQHAGGVAALVKAATYVVGFGVLAVYLVPRGFLEVGSDPAAALDFLLDHQDAMYAWYLVLYLVGGVALVSLVLALHDRLRDAAAGLSQTAGAFGVIWAGILLASGMVSLVGQRAVIELAETDPASASTLWSSVRVVQDALGGGIEIVGAVWVFLVGIACLRSGTLGRGLSALGIAVGVSGAWTLVPTVSDDAAPFFGVGFILWFVWVGVALLRTPRRPV